ncbi:hypothetical protein HETIRDRAFT_442815 [Heterobasidion irregulare TC 32-1]|uniref:Uncharacterized protein n=1 Tax=Heterobasidion irregulare (strain TC 32-1) TaxID=747525 RepID=W4JND4_HETIT|nr:uncharacterized protein HETIRDRAFT_442815 [Heterobasidion irregulare TC 32-1]ETW75072.1 hypothetical protein HETIRDRAFT_442815 [Heterobasidion irregulare TC 32-1]
MSFPIDPTYFPDCPQGIKRHVLDWAQHVCADTIPYYRPYIAKIKHCKREGGVWHEFLIIEFIYPISASATRIVPVIVERTIETGQIPHEMIRPGVDLSAQTGQMNVRSEPAWFHSSSYTSVDSSMTSSTYANIGSSSIPPMGAHALDYIHVPQNGASINSIDEGAGSPYQVCRELTFTSRVTDHNLAALLVAVHEHSPIYNVVSRQCYWYAAVIYDVFCVRHGGRSVDHALHGPLRAGRFLTIFTIQPKDPPLDYILPGSGSKGEEGGSGEGTGCCGSKRGSKRCGGNGEGGGSGEGTGYCGSKRGSKRGGGNGEGGGSGEGTGRREGEGGGSGEGTGRCEGEGGGSGEGKGYCGSKRGSKRGGGNGEEGGSGEGTGRRGEEEGGG